MGSTGATQSGERSVVLGCTGIPHATFIAAASLLCSTSFDSVPRMTGRGPPVRQCSVSAPPLWVQTGFQKYPGIGLIETVPGAETSRMPAAVVLHELWSRVAGRPYLSPANTPG